MAKDKVNVDYEAPWTANLKHRSEPNRVRTIQTPMAAHFAPRAHSELLTPGPGVAMQGQQRPLPAENGEASYYDVPMLKPPVWKWQIALYFYLGGMSGGAYVLSRIADRFGGERFARLARIGSYVALATLAPCPPLLIADLGDPKRFHHMLRVWKPSSPMNFGTWAITAYSGMASFEVVRQFMNKRWSRFTWRERSAMEKLMNSGTVLLAHDAAGVPFALLVASYTGVLLSCTSNPLWCKSSWLAPLFAASAMSNGAEILSLALDMFGDSDPEDEIAQPLLGAIDTVAHVAELLLLRGFMKQAGEKAKPLRGGGMKKQSQFATGAVIAAEVLKRLPVSRRQKRPTRMLTAALGLAGGLALRWAMVFGGHEAGEDPHLCRLATNDNSGDNHGQPGVRAGQ